MRSKTVLIADDDHDLTEALAVRCRELGVNPVIAHDARTAFTLICTSRPDVICLDVAMPSGSGLSVCEMLVHDEELSSIPVIMLTGRCDHTTIQRCHEMCAFYVLKSPDVWSRLKPILRELLNLESTEAEVPVEPPRADSAGRPADRSSQGLTYLVQIVTSQGGMSRAEH